MRAVLAEYLAKVYFSFQILNRFTDLSSVPALLLAPRPPPCQPLQEQIHFAPFVFAYFVKNQVETIT